MGGDNRAPTALEMAAMRGLVEHAMQAGALGLSSGLYYTPGNFATTDEVVELARVAAQYGGIYDTHLRDESSYSIGLLAAVDEALEIGRRASIPVHLAHIKALGVDVWGESEAVIEHVEVAQAAGLKVTADQYPWSASGTHMHNALLPRAFLTGASDGYIEKLGDAAVRDALRAEVTENLRRRGGADALLVVVADDNELVGRTLADIATALETDAVTAAFEIMQTGPLRVASFNMNDDDIESFMVRDWIMTSSDGTDGHPRKYASFPKKYAHYVQERGVLSLPDFLYRSSALTAATLGLPDRGRIAVGLTADIAVIDLESFAPRADFRQWNVLSTGVVHMLVNGDLAIEDGAYTGALAGRVLRPAQ